MYVGCYTRFYLNSAIVTHIVCLPAIQSDNVWSNKEVEVLMQIEPDCKCIFLNTDKIKQFMKS